MQADGAAAWGWCPVFIMKAETCACWCHCLVLLFNCSCIYALRTENRAPPPSTALRPGFWHHYRLGIKECLVRLGWRRDKESFEASGRANAKEDKLPLPAPLKVHLAPAQTVVISEAQASTGHSSNTADTLEIGQHPCSSLRHILRMLHLRVPKHLGDYHWKLLPKEKVGITQHLTWD